jgi:hypothetical protein
MEKYRYQLRYCGAPYGRGEYEIIATAYTESGLERLRKIKHSNPKYYGSNSYINDEDCNECCPGVEIDV